MSGCPTFEALAVFDRPDGAMVTCARVRCAVARPRPDGGAAATYYSRCTLMAADVALAAALDAAVLAEFSDDLAAIMGAGAGVSGRASRAPRAARARSSGPIAGR